MKKRISNRTGIARNGKIFMAIAQAAVAAVFITGCWNGLFTSFTKRDDLGAVPDTARATGIARDFVHFAQFSDVHIVDDASPVRLENINRGSYGGLDSMVQAISRKQDPYSARIWNAVVESINAANTSDALDFALGTGDHTDTGTKTELRWFIEIADGIKSASLQAVIDAGTMEDFTPVGLDVPWYAAVGNHDVEYQGTINSLRVTKSIIGDISDLSRLPQTVDLYADSLTLPTWHGFDTQPASSLEHSYGYYSFNPADYIHCIVLDTAIYNLEGRLPVETLSQGVLDKVQYDWMVSEIEANSNRICIIFSHHNPLGSFSATKSQVSASKLMKTLCSYENVVALVNGHTHVNKIDAITYRDLPGGYWNINTASIIEWPQEWRNITVKDNGDGTGSILCQMMQHSDAESLAVAEADPDANKTKREGTAEDRNVELKFRIPLAVRNHILGL
jgi:3',5'-cyclic AMP phosphodiesterase CpdA